MSASKADRDAEAKAAAFNERLWAEHPELKPKRKSEHAAPTTVELLACAQAMNGSAPFPADLDQREALLRRALDLWSQTRSVVEQTKREGSHVARRTGDEKKGKTYNCAEAIRFVTGQRSSRGRPHFSHWLAELSGIADPIGILFNIKTVRVSQEQAEAWKRSYAKWLRKHKSREAAKSARQKKQK